MPADAVDGNSGSVECGEPHDRGLSDIYGADHGVAEITAGRPVICVCNAPAQRGCEHKRQRNDEQRGEYPMEVLFSAAARLWARAGVLLEVHAYPIPSVPDSTP